MSRPSFKVYHHPDCAETTQFVDILGQMNESSIHSFTIGTDITESQFEVL